MKALEYLTVNDLERVGACANGVSDFVLDYDLRDTCVSVEDLLQAADEDQAVWIRRAAGRAGFGDGFGNGYGYGCGCGNGDGCGYGNDDGLGVGYGIGYGDGGGDGYGYGYCYGDGGGDGGDGDGRTSYGGET